MRPDCVHELSSSMPVMKFVTAAVFIACSSKLQVLLVRHLAESHGFVVRTLSVCSYKISAPMYTVAFRVCGALPLLDSICISAAGVESSGIVDCERSLDTHACDGDGSQSKEAASGGNSSGLRERDGSPESVAGPGGKQAVFIPGERTSAHTACRRSCTLLHKRIVHPAHSKLMGICCHCAHTSVYRRVAGFAGAG
jgi:hypothetical protein